jgi:tetratricopeptide (TPR) repeat protein
VSWATPHWLALAVAALALLPGAVLLGRSRRLEQARVATAGVWRRWLGGAPATGAGRLSLWLVAAALAAAAAAGPRLGATRAAVPATLDLAIALDVSASMGCTDVTPSRLERAVTVLRQALRRMPLGNLALAIGGASAQALVPLTSDRASVEARLAEPDLSHWVLPGSNLAALLGTAAAQLGSSAAARVVLLVSDGEQLEGDAAAMADALRAAGVGVVTLLSGTAEGAPVPRRDAGGHVTYARTSTGELVRSRANPELLVRAASGAGDAIDASSPAAARQLVEALARAARGSTRELAPAQRAPLVLAAALAATASFLLWPWRKDAFATLLLPLPLLAAMPTPTNDVPTTWQRILPGAATVLARRAEGEASRGAWEEARRDYARSLRLDPGDGELRLGSAVAAAMSGGSETALTALANDPKLGATALFDLGTARLLRGDAQGAVEALRRAVVAQPNDAAAWRNLELALLRVEAEHGSTTSADPLAKLRRERLVAAAARAALQPLWLRAPEVQASSDGRDW